MIGAATLLLAGCSSAELAREHGRGMGETMTPLDAEALGRGIVDQVVERLLERLMPSPAPRPAPEAPPELPTLPAPPATYTH